MKKPTKSKVQPKTPSKPASKTSPKAQPKKKEERIKRSIELKRLIGSKKYHYYLESEQWGDEMRLRYSQIFVDEESAIEAKSKNAIQWKQWQSPN